MKLASTRIVTDDVRALARFYAAITGEAPIGTDEYVELATPTGTLSIVSKRGVDLFHAGVAMPRANRSVIVEFEVPDVDWEHARLKAMVGRFVMGPTNHPWGCRSMLFRDPDGNPISFFTPAGLSGRRQSMRPL